ncbi:MAG TPA: ATP-dependent DNA ligase [Pirellulales bacterium]
MKQFASLYRCLDETTKTSRKIDCLCRYFRAADPADACWAVYFLIGRKPKRLLRTADLRHWCAEEAGVPEWLFDECHEIVGDLAETIALLLPEPRATSDLPLHQWIERRLLELPRLDAVAQRAMLVDSWLAMDRTERLVWNKLLTGAFRVGVSQSLVVRALAETAGVEAAAVSHRLMGAWEPSAEFFRRLTAAEADDVDVARPYPFCLAHPLEGPPDSLGDVTDWQAEWKWDGIRAQLIRRQGLVSLWTRGEELVTERFPELGPAAAGLPDGTVLDGEIVAWKAGGVLPFSLLQQRIGRKTLGKKILESVPVRFVAFDVLERAGQDVRGRPLFERRQSLESLAGESDSAIMLSPVEPAASWQELALRREQSRQHNVEGIMLKSRHSAYGVGRVTGVWWKWKIDPYTVDAVLIYAQLGHGRRAGLYTDYTFGVWHEDKLVPFAKAYSGLTDDEIREVDRFVRQNTIDRFGPVRHVKPELVFEIAFENILLSSRHKSGVAVRFPRIARWRTDKPPSEADSLQSIRALLRAAPAGGR